MLYSKIRGREKVVIKKSKKKIVEEIKGTAVFDDEVEGKNNCKKYRRKLWQPF